MTQPDEYYYKGLVELVEYKEHIASLKTYPVSGTVPEYWLKGEVLEEGMDYELDSILNKYFEKIIVAVPVKENKPKNNNMKTGIELIAEERKEQIEKHGRTIEGDAAYICNELTIAAVALLEQRKEQDIYLGKFPADWDENICLHMARKPYLKRLIIVGALVAAEIDAEIQRLK